MVAACTAMLMLLTGGSALAQAGDAERARVHFEAATRAFEEGDYALAITEFQAAYEITEHADLLFNIYSAAERAGRLEEAESALARYLELGRPGRQRRSLEARLGRLRLRIEEERAAAPPPPEPVVEEPAPEPVVAVAEPTEPIEPAPPVDAEPVASGGGVHPAGVVTLVGAGLLLANFGVFAALSEIEDQALSARCGRDVGAMCAPSEVQTLDAFSLVADVSWIAGATAAVLGVVLLLALPPEEETRSVAFAPWVTPQGAGGEVVGRW